MAVRCLEELDLAKSVVARALLSELGGMGRAEPGRPLEQTVAVTRDRLLAYRAVNDVCRYMDDADEFLCRQVMALRDVRFQSGGGGAAIPRFEQVALFNIVEVREWSDAGVDLGSGGAPVYWMVRGGLWAGSHLRQPCRSLLCRIARASLDPDRDSAALLVLRIGSMVLAGACPGAARNPVTTTVEEILAAAGRLPVRQLRTTAWGRRTADDLLVAARALHAAGVVERLETPVMPGDRDLDSGAIERWLQASSEFTAGSVVG